MLKTDEKLMITKKTIVEYLQTQKEKPNFVLKVFLISFSL